MTRAPALFAGTRIRTAFSPLQEAAKLDLKLSDLAISLVQGLAGGERRLAASLAATGLAAGVVSLAGYVVALRNPPRRAIPWRRHGEPTHLSEWPTWSPRAPLSGSREKPRQGEADVRIGRPS